MKPRLREVGAETVDAENTNPALKAGFAEICQQREPRLTPSA